MLIGLKLLNKFRKNEILVGSFTWEGEITYNRYSEIES